MSKSNGAGQFIARSQAEARGLSFEQLARYANENRIRTQIDPATGITRFWAADVERIVDDQQQFPQRENFEHLSGQEIWISEAARKYGMTGATLYRWSRKGRIRRVGREGNRVLLDEADVAYCAAIYNERNGKRGRRIFDSSGKPYIPTDSRTLAAMA